MHIAFEQHHGAQLEFRKLAKRKNYNFELIEALFPKLCLLEVCIFNYKIL